MSWQPQSRPPVPHYPPSYWANVAQIIAQGAPRNDRVPPRRRPPGTVASAWQPPTSGVSIISDGNGVISS